MNVTFTQSAFEELCEWATTNRQVFKKIHTLILDIARNGAESGIGKPERLKYVNAWSRRITDEHRLVYQINVTNNNVIIHSCMGHYED